MSTHAIIGVKRKDGSIIASKVIKSGYPEWTGKTLNAYYNDENKALELVSMGAILELCETIEEIKFYYRDLGQDWEAAKPNEFDNLEGFNKYLKRWRQDFYYHNYLFEDGMWKWSH